MLASVIAVGLGYDRGRLIAYLCVVVPMFTVCFVWRILGVVGLCLRRLCWDLGLGTIR